MDLVSDELNQTMIAVDGDPAAIQGQVSGLSPSANAGDPLAASAPTGDDTEYKQMLRDKAAAKKQIAKLDAAMATYSAEEQAKASVLRKALQDTVDRAEFNRSLCTRILVRTVSESSSASKTSTTIATSTGSDSSSTKRKRQNAETIDEIRQITAPEVSTPSKFTDIFQELVELNVALNNRMSKGAKGLRRKHRL